MQKGLDHGYLTLSAHHLLGASSPPSNSDPAHWYHCLRAPLLVRLILSALLVLPLTIASTFVFAVGAAPAHLCDYC